MKYERKELVVEEFRVVWILKLKISISAEADSYELGWIFSCLKKKIKKK